MGLVEYYDRVLAPGSEAEALFTRLQDFGAITDHPKEFLRLVSIVADDPLSADVFSVESYYQQMRFSLLGESEHLSAIQEVVLRQEVTRHHQELIKRSVAMNLLGELVKFDRDYAFYESIDEGYRRILERVLDVMDSVNPARVFSQDI